jgi:hypothetical protein
VPLLSNAAVDPHVRSINPSEMSKAPNIAVIKDENLGIPRNESTLVPRYASARLTMTTPTLCSRLLRRLIVIPEVAETRFLAIDDQPPLIAGTMEMSHPAETLLASPPVN